MTMRHHTCHGQTKAQNLHGNDSFAILVPVDVCHNSDVIMEMGGLCHDHR